MILKKYFIEGEILKENKLIADVSTVTTMIKIYCKGNHGREELCVECLELAQYAEKRVKNCKFGHKKPVCAKCTVHCYKPEMREKIIQVMRYSGPKMIKHPVMLLRHVKDKLIY
ncbi:MAG: nitrous oxide-stimulated promoter family protein [Tissierellia bacterium]|nr:nitrous oxide-stimulated promoter family protein [Tissierellia bacterium]